MSLNHLAFWTLSMYTAIKRRPSTLTGRNCYDKDKQVQIFYDIMKTWFLIRHSSKGRCDLLLFLCLVISDSLRPH